MKQWNEAFKERGKIFIEPQQDILNISNIFKKSNVKKILDLGSGTGRHVICLAKNGFDLFGIDVAEEGIKITKDWLRKEKLRANLKTGSIYSKLPYKDNFFDAVVSTQTIHHERIETIRKTILELERILKPGGLIFITVRKRKFNKSYAKNAIIEKYGKQKSRYKIIAPRTYVPIEGEEKGLPHYLFNKELIRKSHSKKKYD